jgi:cob(I)alamin adenosyltransferase
LKTTTPPELELRRRLQNPKQKRTNTMTLPMNPNNAKTERAARLDVIRDALRTATRELQALDSYGETWEAVLSIANAEASLRLHLAGYAP